MKETSMTVSEKLRDIYYVTKLPYAKHNTPEGKAYSEDTIRLEAEFKADAFEELGITDNPKRDLLYSKAWEHGHSAGYCDVWYYLQDLVDLILPV